MVLAIVRVLHLILPAADSDCWVHEWLAEKQIASLDKFFSSAGLGALIGHFSRQMFGKAPKERED